MCVSAQKKFVCWCETLMVPYLCLGCELLCGRFQEWMKALGQVLQGISVETQNFLKPSKVYGLSFLNIILISFLKLCWGFKNSWCCLKASEIISTFQCVKSMSSSISYLISMYLQFSYGHIFICTCIAYFRAGSSRNICQTTAVFKARPGLWCGVIFNFDRSNLN